MARALMIVEAKDANGTAQPSAQIRVYNLGTTTPYSSSIYAAASGGSPLTQPFTPDSLGRLWIYTDAPSRASVQIGSATPVVGEFYVDTSTVPRLDAASNTFTGSLSATSLSLTGANHWLFTGYDTASQGSQSQSARTTTSDTIKKVQIQHGTMGAPVVNNNSETNYPGFDFYGPNSSMTFLARQRPISNNCLYNGSSITTHIPDDSLWEWVFDSRITADASANNPMGMSGIYGLVARSTADKQMKGVTLCKHGVAGADPQTYYRNALTAITRTEGTDNSAVATFYAEGTMNTTAVLSPYANVKAAEITVRQGQSTTTPADDAPAFNTTTLGPRYLYGIALEMGREEASSGKYGTVGLYVAGDSGSIDGAWRTGVAFGRSSCLEYGIDFAWMNLPISGSPGVLPSVGALRLPNNSWVVAPNAASTASSFTNINVLRLNTSDAIEMYNGALTMLPPSAIWRGSSAAGISTEFTVSQTDNTNVNSHSYSIVQTAGSSGGDPMSVYRIGSGAAYGFGVDNSDSDALVLAYGTAVPALGTNNLLRATSTSVALRDGTNTRFEVNGTGIGFYGTSPGAKPTITGSRGSNAALASLLTALATLGLLTDSTS